MDRSNRRLILEPTRSVFIRVGIRVAQGVIAVCLCATLAAGQIGASAKDDSISQEDVKGPSPSDATPTRTIHFPKDRSLGTLNTKLRGATGKWETSRPAQGGIEVPVNHYVELAPDVKAAADLSQIEALAPADIHRLNFSHAPTDDAQLAHVAHLTGLEELFLDRSRITDEGLQYLSRMTSLRYLSLSGTLVEGSGLVHLKGMTSLKILHLDETPLEGREIQHLTHLTSLERLNLSKSGINDDAAPYLQSISSLKYLNFYGAQVGYFAAARIRNSLPDCEILSGFYTLRTEDVRSLVAKYPARTLHFPADRLVGVLSAGGDRMLSGVEVGEARGDVEIPSGIRIALRVEQSVEDLSFLQRFGPNDLQSIEMMGPVKIGDADLVHLKGLTGLEGLYLVGVELSDAGLAHIQHITSLTNLRLSYCRITDEGLALLSGMTSMKNLELKGSSGITDAGLIHLKGMKSLGRLDLSDTPITDNGLAHLKEMTSLKQLNLSYNSIGDDGMIHLKGLTSLEHLSLYNTSVTGAGLVHVRDLPALKALYLMNTPLQDENLVYLKFMPALETLNLWNTPITDKAVEHLKDLTRLDEVAIVETRITDDGAKRLSDALPPYSHVNTRRAMVHWATPLSLSEEEATKLAATIANNECERLYGRRPFTPEQFTAKLEEKIWSLTGSSVEEGFSAEVGFNTFCGKDQKVHVVNDPVQK